MKSILNIQTIFLLMLIPLTLGVKADEPLYKKSFDEIIKKYHFINDFSSKPGTRKISDHLFWQYRFKIPPPSFPIVFDMDDPNEEMPPSNGEGRETEHINKGRTYFLQGNYELARQVWLTSRQRFGKSGTYHRRNDYFVALAFLQLAKADLAKGLDYQSSEVKSYLANAATFLSWALIVKKDHPDKLIDKVASKQFYNLASIYFKYERWAGAHGAATRAIEFLNKTGQRSYRPLLRRMLAESHIKNRTYLNAVKELDVAIRQDVDRKQAAAMFARVADIYFDLNNYELAEYAYAIANRIDRESEQINPAQFVLRGESLFWLGQFAEAQKNFLYALERSSNKAVAKSAAPDYLSKAHLRIADSYLALKKYDKAKLEYFRVMHEHRGTLEADIARVRNACLELPFFNGQNLKHSRVRLAAIKKNPDLPYEAVELAWACEVSSYSQRERTSSMVERVQKFFEKYPNSRFLASLIEPVREVKASKLNEFIKKKQYYNAISYFEKTRETLFKDIPEQTRRNLFVAYLDTFNPEKAREFWPSFQTSKGKSDLEKLMQAAFVAEMSVKSDDKKWTKLSKEIAKGLRDHKWSIDPTPIAKTYLQRSISSDQSEIHLPWAYELGKHWAQKDTLEFCPSAYPLLSRMTSQTERAGAYSLANLRSEVSNHIKELMPTLLSIDEPCAISLLELEIEVFDSMPQELAARYLSRSSWRLSKPLTSLYWEVAEKNATAGKANSARDLWVYIRDNAPKDAPEISFARIRLDPTKTEFDALWQ